MESERTQTGYPSVDKPWLKYYNEASINSSLPQCTIYDYLRKCNENHLGDVALEYFGKTIKYKELHLYIQNTQYAFEKLGIKQGEIVALCMPNTPEGVIAFYALNKMGAIVNLIDPRTAPVGIKNFCNETSTKILVVIELCLPKIEKIIDDSQLEKVVVVPVEQSMPWHIKILYKCKKKKSKLTDSRFMWWNNLDFSECELTPNSRHDKNQTAVIAHTGGTTGTPKGVVLTEMCFNMLDFHRRYGYTSMKKRDKILDIMPMFSAYGAIWGMHVPLCSGMHVQLIPKFDFDKFADMVMKKKPNHIIAVPSLFEDLVRKLDSTDADLSFLHSATVGGDKMNGVTENRVNAFFHKHSADIKLFKGYGLTEVSSSATFTVCQACNELESVGIPLLYNSVKIVSAGTTEELPYNSVGEVCLSGLTVMTEYYNNSEATAQALKMHEDGINWLHTGDLGYVNENGVLYIKDRIKRVIFGPNGHTVFPCVSEEIITSHSAVEICAVVGLQNDRYENARIPTAFVVRKPCEKLVDNEVLKAELDALCKNSLPDCDCPYQYVFVEQLPHTAIGKVDYRALESYRN